MWLINRLGVLVSPLWSRAEGRAPRVAAEAERVVSSIP